MSLFDDIRTRVGKKRAQLREATARTGCLHEGEHLWSKMLCEILDERLSHPPVVPEDKVLVDREVLKDWIKTAVRIPGCVACPVQDYCTSGGTSEECTNAIKAALGIE